MGLRGGKQREHKIVLACRKAPLDVGKHHPRTPMLDENLFNIQGVAQVQLVEKEVIGDAQDAPRFQ